MTQDQLWHHPPRVLLAVIMPRGSRRGLMFQPHRHSFHEIGFVLEGECDWHVEGRRESLCAGDLLIVPAGTEHFEQTHEDRQARIAWLGFDFADETPLPASLRGPLSTGAWQDDITRILEVISTERQTQALAHPERIELAMRELLLLICRLPVAPPKKPARAQPAKAARVAELVRSAALTLSSNLAQPIRIRDLAHYHTLSTAHFSQTFRRHMGITPGRYLQNARLERAKSLLAETRLNTKEIAAACGYVDAAHFCHAFKAATGSSPKQWRDDSPPPLTTALAAAEAAARSRKE